GSRAWEIKWRQGESRKKVSGGIEIVSAGIRLPRGRVSFHDVLIWITCVVFDRRTVIRSANAGSAQSLAGIVAAAQQSGEWTTSDCCEYGAELPAASQALSERPERRERIQSAGIEIQPHIVVAISPRVAKVRHRGRGAANWVDVVQLRVIAGASAINRVHVETLAPGQVVLRVQPVPGALVVGNLQTVVLRFALIRGLNHVLQGREGSRERTQWIATGAHAIAAHGGRVQIVVDDQIASPLSHIRQRQDIVAEQLRLNAQVEVVVMGRLEILHDRECVEGWSARWISAKKRPVLGSVETDVVASLGYRIVARGTWVIGRQQGTTSSRQVGSRGHIKEV